MNHKDYRSASGAVLNVGDRVIATEGLGGGLSLVKPNETGTILKLDRDDRARVRWDTWNRFKHSCKGLCEDGHGWVVSTRFLELLEDHTEITDDAFASILST